MIKGLLTDHVKGDLNFMKYLWHLYKVHKDFEFWEYMKHKKQDINDNYPRSTLTIDEFIRSASKMYTLHTHKDYYICRSKSPERSDIVALKAEVRQLKGNLQLAGKIMKKYGSTTSSENTNAFNKSKKNWLKEDLDFIVIKKNLSKDDEHHS